MSGEAVCVFSVGEPVQPGSPNIFLQWHFVLSKILAPVQKAIALWSPLGLSRSPTFEIGKVSL